MMKRQLYIVFSFLTLVIGFAACKKGNTYYEDYQLKDTEFKGTTLNFLETQGSVYDSLLLALERVPDLRSKLNSTTDTLTFFATTNSSFTNALEAMNAVRKASNRAPLFIEDIPQIVLDSLMYHYAFNGNYNTNSLEEFKEGKEVRAIDNYRMHLMFKVTSASGITNGGQQQIKLSDINNSIFQRYWQESNTSVVNIKTTNGTVHILSPSHNFGFSKLAKILNK
ncbi:fasciclin domain-containing protein [Sphingobacterium sp. SRCM116780]|uniref:fasciclin domain-containing protein n=1 Tax=Sphingobacterium sp. SRCM116780 TaxID=2907623 RepID=UPI001F403664|nr:fasciclin domain-containing protein [Sphingobacterium sp. SRCM116780]UIR55387.1 fasciclin domain-containing protein [Sphingobacterium sp. SRCM116780]